ncbi:cupin domain-containing protein [Bauldia sp.]|uniref:cupin domain-containing protein n=1 Tax=Bauldia sp. TaxID=2575872 RepID=UPI0025B7AA9A|nr:cupin domain-containing protein [Bauldia sp.]
MFRRPNAAQAANPYIPGARILPGRATCSADLGTGVRYHLYPLSELNDLGFFARIEMATDEDSSLRAHPDFNLYVLCLEGSGQVRLGGTGGYGVEHYEFEAGDLVIVPRDVPYCLAGAFKAVALHARTNAFGKAAPHSRFCHPVLDYLSCGAEDGPNGAYLFDPLCSQRLEVPVPYGSVAASPHRADAEALYRNVTPRDPQTGDAANQAQELVNPSVIGARLLRKAVDAPEVYNANAGNKQWAFPLTWTDDLAICIGATHSSISDRDRPFDSHSHPDVEEYKYIISGRGTVTIGDGDPTVETEVYDYEAGDLVILPRGMPHVDAGDYTALYFHTRQSVFGKVPGTSRYPHGAYVYTKPPRPTKEERAALNEPGTYVFMDSRETLNVFVPNPIERIEHNPTGLTHLRPDLFPGEPG